MDVQETLIRYITEYVGKGADALVAGDEKVRDSLGLTRKATADTETAVPTAAAAVSTQTTKQAAPGKTAAATIVDANDEIANSLYDVDKVVTATGADVTAKVRARAHAYTDAVDEEIAANEAAKRSERELASVALSANQTIGSSAMGAAADADAAANQVVAANDRIRVAVDATARANIAATLKERQANVLLGEQYLALARQGGLSTEARVTAYQLASKQFGAAGEQARFNVAETERGTLTGRRGAQLSREAQRESRGFLAGSGALGGRFGRALALGSTAFIGGAIAGQVVRGGVSDLMAQQRAQVNLEQSVKSSGQSWQRYGQQLTTTSERLSRMGGFQIPEVESSLAALDRSTGSVTKSQTDLSAAMDLARGRGMSLTGATQLLLRASYGQVGILHQYGINVTAVKTAEDLLTNSHAKVTAQVREQAKQYDRDQTSLKVIAAVQRQYAGQTQAYGRTAAGSFARAHVAITDTEEAVTRGLLPSLTVGANAVTRYANEWVKSGHAQALANTAAQQIRSTIHTVGPIIMAVAHAANAVASAMGGWGRAATFLIAGRLALGAERAFHAMSEGEGTLGRLRDKIKGMGDLWQQQYTIARESSSTTAAAQIADSNRVTTASTTGFHKMTIGSRGYRGALATTAATEAEVGTASTVMAAESEGAFVAMRAAAVATFATIRAAMLTLGWTALIIAAGYVITHWDQVKKWFEAFWKYMRAGFNVAWRAIKITATIFVDGIKGLFYAWLTSVVGYMKLFVDAAGKAFGWLPFGVGKAVKNAQHTVDGWFTDFRHKSASNFKAAAEAAGQYGTVTGNMWGSNFYNAASIWAGRTSALIQASTVGAGPLRGVAPATFRPGSEAAFRSQRATYEAALRVAEQHHQVRRVAQLQTIVKNLDTIIAGAVTQRNRQALAAAKRQYQHDLATPGVLPGTTAHDLSILQQIQQVSAASAAAYAKKHADIAARRAHAAATRAADTMVAGVNSLTSSLNGASTVMNARIRARGLDPRGSEAARMREKLARQQEATIREAITRAQSALAYAQQHDLTTLAERIRSTITQLHDRLTTAELGVVAAHQGVATTALQTAVTRAQTRVSAAISAEATLAARQRIQRTYGTPAGAEARTQLITQQVLPALHAELTAINNEMKAARRENNPQKVAQLQKQAQGVRDQISRQQLGELRKISKNTSLAAQALEGNLGLEFQGETFLDQSLASLVGT